LKPKLSRSRYVYEKNLVRENFAGYRSEYNFVGILKIMSNAAKKFDILAAILSILHNYFDSTTKLLF